MKFSSNYVLGCNEISIQLNDYLGVLPNEIAIKRRENGKGVSSNIEIGSVSSIDVTTSAITIRDYNVIKGREYVYTVVPTINAVVQAGTVGVILTDFSGLSIGNLNASYITDLNMKCSYKQTRSVSYVSTYNSRYPKSVANGLCNYAVGSAEGIFLPLDVNGNPCLDNSLAYQDEVIAFLSDNTPKTLRTHDSKAFLVQVDQDITIAENEYWGAPVIQFNWTQIGELPTSGIVVITQ